MYYPGPVLSSLTRTICSYRNTTQKETSLLGQSDGGQPRGPTDGSIAREWVSYMMHSIAPGHPLQRVLYIYTPTVSITKTKKWPSLLVKLTSLIACHSAGRRPRGLMRVSVLGPLRACGPKIACQTFSAPDMRPKEFSVQNWKKIDNIYQFFIHWLISHGFKCAKIKFDLHDTRDCARKWIAKSYVYVSLGACLVLSLIHIWRCRRRG